MKKSKYQRPIKKGSGKAVFIDGVRTPFVKSFGVFKDCDTLDLFSAVVDGIIRKTDIDPMEIDEVSAGVVVPQPKNGNVARDAIINLGLPNHIHGYTMNRACTSSLHTVADAVKEITFGHPSIVLAGGVECLSDVPIVYSLEARKFLLALNKAKTNQQRFNILKKFKLADWMPRPPALAEPLTGLTMGQSAEVMAKINKVTREEQDKFAVRSHENAVKAQKEGALDEEVIPVWPRPKFEAVEMDNIARASTSVEALAKLRPVFDRKHGSLTAGNSSPLTDGASIAMIADEERAKELGLKAKSRIVDFEFVGVDPMEQLLIGPAVAIPQILKRNNLTLDDIDRFEIHEAFAAQVLSCIKSMESKEFCKRYFGTDEAFGSIPEEKLNVNGGAIAIGHPFGATGVRLLTSLSNELIRSNKRYGLIAICAAGGMASAMLIERVEN